MLSIIFLFLSLVLLRFIHQTANMVEAREDVHRFVDLSLSLLFLFGLEVGFDSDVDFIRGL